MMTPDRRAANDLQFLGESNSRFQPDDELAPSFGWELIARQRALVRDIKDVISLTRKIIETTREQLDALSFLNGGSRPAAAHESHSPSEAEPEARRS
jgi:hypothetical protein